jgi:hypothetical protein
LHLPQGRSGRHACSEPVGCGGEALTKCAVALLGECPAQLVPLLSEGPLQLFAGGLGNDRLLAMSRGMLGRAYYWAGELERARALAQEAVGRARQLGDDVLLGMCL